jgi:hypothetical protein
MASRSAVVSRFGRNPLSVSVSSMAAECSSGGLVFFLLRTTMVDTARHSRI